MPMSFPNMESLKRHASLVRFRQPNEDESEESYRAALANHVEPNDYVEAHEIRSGKGWNEWDKKDKGDFINGVFKRGLKRG